MKLQIDYQVYHIDFAKVMLHVKSWYVANSEKMSKMEIGNGQVIDMSKKSLLRIGLKTALIPFAIPMLKYLYQSRGYELPKHEKHSDLIDYIAFSLLDFLALIEKDVNLHASSVPVSESSDRNITSLSPFKQQQLNPPENNQGKEN